MPPPPRFAGFQISDLRFQIEEEFFMPLIQGFFCVTAIVGWLLNRTYLYQLRLHSFHKFAFIRVHSWFPIIFFNRELRE